MPSFLIADTGMSLTELDAGKYSARLWVAAGSFDWGAAANMSLVFKNSVGATISTATSGQIDIRPSGLIQEYELTAAIPALTRQITITLAAGHTAERTGDGTNPSTVYDSIRLEAFHTDADTDALDAFGMVEYEAIVAGTTASSQPGFTHGMAEEIVDGGVTWRAVTPRWTQVGEIGTVTSHTQFTVPSLDAPDDLFKWGVLTFLSGNNRLRGIEVTSWNNSTKVITLMLPALWMPEAGDVIKVHAGCDKTRGIGGCKRFENIVNYRGEPEVPDWRPSPMQGSACTLRFRSAAGGRMLTTSAEPG